MIRLTDSALNVAASASDVEVESKIVNLNQLIPDKGLAKPLAMKFKATTGALADITCKKLIIASDVNPESQYQVYKGAGIDLADLNDMLSPAANAGKALPIVPFDVEHGLKLVMTLSNAQGSAYVGIVLWKLANAVPGQPGISATGAARGVGGNRGAVGGNFFGPAKGPSGGLILPGVAYDEGYGGLGAKAGFAGS